MDYTKAGVNIDAATDVVDYIKDKVKTTHSSSVLAGIGSFGTLYSLSDIVRDYENPVLVQSIDGVGTKIKVGVMAGKYKGLGMDIVNHCCNDILCQGARALTFLDYYGVSKMDTAICKEVLDGMIEACYASSVSLVGGELAELPGVYETNELDIVGAITGVVDRDKAVTGANIQPGDVIIGLSSNGLHTNGYSLARKVLFDMAGLTINDKLSNGETLAEALLKPHLNYAPEVLPLLDRYDIRGMAHITGGGLIDNVPRILQKNVDAKFDCSAIDILEIFKLIQKKGGVEPREMFRTLNMGCGYIIVVPPAEVETLLKDLESPKFSAKVVGEIVPGTGMSQLTNL